MLRLTLGISGMVLIALGVFGGSMLEDTHQAVSNFFAPNTVIAKSTAEDSVSPKPVEKLGVVPADRRLETETEIVPSTNSPLELAGGETIAEVQASSSHNGLLKTGMDNDRPPIGVENENLSIEEPSKESIIDKVVEATTGSVADNTLFVLKDRVNLREGPSIDHAIVLQLELGQELMEFKRDGKWVHVGAYGTSGKIGWVHGTLVGKN